MKEEPKSERFNLFMSPSEVEALDQWAWANRIRSKSEAVRRLLQIGMRSSQYAAPILSNAAKTLDLLVKLNEQSADILDRGSTEAELSEIGSLYIASANEILEGQILVRQQAADLIQEMLDLLDDESFEASLELVHRSRQLSRENLDRLRGIFSNPDKGVDG